VQEQAGRVRAGVGLFALPERGVVSVVGADRGRWLNGMLSNEVAALEPGLSNSGCYAVLLTPQGRIVSDLHVLQRGDAYWLETAVAAIPAAMTHLDRLLIADDVQLEDASAQWARFALEGPRSLETLLRAADGGGEGLGPDCATDIEQSVHLDRRLGLSEVRPGEHRQAQIYGGRVQRIEGLIQIEGQGIIPVQTAGNGNEDVGEILEDAEIAALVGIGQGGAG
jgi:folate-binding Fe-S cluster repair protein YgfZ